MVKKGHKYMTLFQINTPRVMILSQKLGKCICQGDIYLTVRDIYLTGRGIYLTIRDIHFEKGHNLFYKFLGGRIFDHVYELICQKYTKEKAAFSCKLEEAKDSFPDRLFHIFGASKSVSEIQQIRRLSDFEAAKL